MRSLKTTWPNLSISEVYTAHTTAVAAVRSMPEKAMLLADNWRVGSLKHSLKEKHSFDEYPKLVTASFQDEHAVPREMLIMSSNNTAISMD